LSGTILEDCIILESKAVGQWSQSLFRGTPVSQEKACLNISITLGHGLEAAQEKQSELSIWDSSTVLPRGAGLCGTISGPAQSQLASTPGCA
jgi:hypothetical protein